MKNNKNLVWYEQLKNNFDEIFKIALEYSNPFLNDAGGSSLCDDILKAIKPFKEKINKWLLSVDRKFLFEILNQHKNISIYNINRTIKPFKGKKEYLYNTWLEKF